MKLNIYKSQTEVEKVLEAEAYDLMYGTVEDILAILDEVDDLADNEKLVKAVRENRHKLNELLKDVFPEATDEDLRKIKLKELVPFFIELFAFVRGSFGDKEKN